MQLPNISLAALKHMKFVIIFDSYIRHIWPTLLYRIVIKSDPQKKNAGQVPLMFESDRNTRVTWLMSIITLAVPNSIFAHINRIKEKRKNTHTKFLPQGRGG